MRHLMYERRGGGAAAGPVTVRRLMDHEGQKLQRIVRRGSTSSVRYRRAMMLLASAARNTLPVIACPVQPMRAPSTR
ncbi:transposase [Spongiactinospora rosea]|uniref:Transposase n=1 Tax=Spongiactinospora rosea TaxID=2248750 RepID=A0A366LND1_9ACTN|nr:transposase [Spongiactinospora rosea]